MIEGLKTQVRKDSSQKLGKINLALHKNRKKSVKKPPQTANLKLTASDPSALNLKV